MKNANEDCQNILWMVFEHVYVVKRNFLVGLDQAVQLHKVYMNCFLYKGFKHYPIDGKQLVCPWLFIEIVLLLTRMNLTILMRVAGEHLLIS